MHQVYDNIFDHNTTGNKKLSTNRQFVERIGYQTSCRHVEYVTGAQADFDLWRLEMRS